ncbi:hypothetical protein PVAG01_06821 [Phlyctema vagabunda]|uniref:Glutathione transferase n=1 Tax=Phlyctema vagabunda TaxID=108571 RepID=A0ABR4PH74_9HELO
MTTPNYSVYGIPVYYLLSLYPHGYAMKQVSKALPGGIKSAYDNRNPRAASSTDAIRRQVPADVFAVYERAESAHKNGMENFPLIATAIVLGNVAKLSPRTLNTTVACYLLTRVGYTYMYITSTTRKRSLVRTAVWNAGVGLCLFLIVKAAGKLKDLEGLGL